MGRKHLEKKLAKLQLRLNELETVRVTLEGRKAKTTHALRKKAALNSDSPSSDSDSSSTSTRSRSPRSRLALRDSSAPTAPPPSSSSFLALTDAPAAAGPPSLPSSSPTLAEAPKKKRGAPSKYNIPSTSCPLCWLAANFPEATSGRKLDKTKADCRKKFA